MEQEKERELNELRKAQQEQAERDRHERETAEERFEQQLKAVKEAKAQELEDKMKEVEDEAHKEELKKLLTYRPLEDAVGHFDTLLLKDDKQSYRRILNDRHQIKLMGQLETAYMINELSTSFAADRATPCVHTRPCIG